MSALVSELLNELKGKEIAEQLQILASRFPGEVVFSTSFGLEDQAITYFIASDSLLIHKNYSALSHLQTPLMDLLPDNRLKSLDRIFQPCGSMLNMSQEKFSRYQG